MCKKYMLGFLLICIGVPLSAMSAQKCVDFRNIGLWSNSVIAEKDTVDWVLEFPNLTVKGIGVCSNKTGSYGDVAENISTNFLHWQNADNYEATNSNCWCRIISPGVSQWVMYEDYGDVEECLEACNQDCWVPITYDSDYRRKFINSMGGH